MKNLIFKNSLTYQIYLRKIVFTLRVAIFFITCVICPLSVHANLAVTNIVTLTLKQAVEKALNNNPEIRRAREAYEQAQSDHSSAFSNALPVINSQLQYNYQKDPTLMGASLFNGEPYNQYQFGLTLTQPLFDSGAMFAAIRYSNKNKQLKEYALQIAERDTVESIIKSFYTLLLNEKLLEILKNSNSVYESTLKTAEQYARLGRIQRVDLLQLRTQTALIKPKIVQAQNSVQTSAMELATLLHELSAGSIHAQGRLVSPDVKWVNGTLDKKANLVPEILQSQLQVNQFDDQKTLTMSPHWPKLNLIGQWSRSAYAKTDLLDSAATRWALGLQLTIPLFSGLSSISQRSSLASQKKQIELNDVKVIDGILLKQTQTENDFKVAQTQLEAAELAAKYGQESLAEADKSFKYSSINYLQYQGAQQAYLDSQTGFHQAKYNYLLATARYFDAIGVPIRLLVDELDRLSR